MLKDEIKIQMIQAMKDKDVIRKEILRVVLGEFQTIESRESQITEERCQKVIRKIIENNKEVILIVKPEDVEKLEKENEILESFLPKLLTKEEILGHLTFSSDSSIGKAVMEEPNVGKAIGLAMKYFKDNNIPVNGKDVAEVVKEMKR